MQATTVSFLLLLLSPQPNISYSLPPGCSYGKLPHSLWGCSRPTGGVCGLKRHIVCTYSPIVLKKTPPTSTSMATSTTSPRLSDPITGSDMQTNIEEQHLAVKFPRLLSGRPGKVTRRRKSNRLSSNLVVTWLCTTRYWLPSCQASPSHAIQMVWKNLLQGQNLL